MKKQDSDKFKKKIQRIFTDAGRRILNYKQIASKLEITSSEEKNEILKVLKKLAADEILEEISPGKYIAKFRHHFISGRIEITARGSAYVIPEGEDKSFGDIFISNDNLSTSLDGDTVKVNLFAHKIGDRQTGEVVEVIKRNKTEFVGIVQLSPEFAFLKPDNRKVHVDIFIPKNKINGAKDGVKAVAKITEWTIDKRNPIGEIINILGKPGEHETEINSIVTEFGFALSFPDAVEKEANNISQKISKSEIDGRRDFRKISTFTIDPDDAKDFDDALSFKNLDDDTYEIGIHIADVAHYVTKDSALDKEAFLRGTSVYLVDRTVPMLPEKLSNGLCSLRPNEEKLTFSVVVKMNKEAEVLETWIGKTIIYSDRRFAYEEAQKIIEEKNGEFAKELETLNGLALKLREERFRHNAINFETVEVKFRLDENNKPIDVYIKERKDAHKLIEEFMLLANKKVAEFANSSKGEKSRKTFVYRVHEEPSDEKIKLFSIFAGRFGYKINTTSSRSIASSLNKILVDTEGKPEQNVIQSLAVRTMQKAFYTTKKSGHYGLAFDNYTHFTSPIRRYPDLMVHRLLFDYLNGKKSANQDEYEEYCKHSSAREINASEAERASIRFKQVEYISQFVGEEFDGIISGVTEWGIYAEITQYKCEGMIRLASLESDYYEFDEYNQWIIGRNTRKKFQLGDKVKVLVLAANIYKRQIDMTIADDLPSSNKGGRREKFSSGNKRKRR